MKQSEKIGLVSSTAIGLGAIIGAGIFVLSGTTIALAGTGALLAFLLTGITAAILALEIGELTSKMPKERGAAYSFAYEAFGSELGFVTGIMLYVAYMASVSAIALGFGAYLASLLGITSQLYVHAFAVLLILALIGINYFGIRRAANADTLLVAFKILVLVVFVGFALFAGKWTASSFSGMLDNGWSGIFSASVIALFAYEGFQAIAAVTPDMKGGGRQAAKAILIAVGASIVLYVSVVASMMALVPASQYKFIADPLSYALKASSAPSLLFVLVAIAALVATASASLSMLIGGSHLIYQMSEDGLVPQALAETRKGSATPLKALVATSLISIVTLFAGNIYIIAAISNFGIIFSFVILSFAVIKVRRIERMQKAGSDIFNDVHLSRKNVFQAPLYPILPVLSIASLILFFYGFPTLALSSGVGTLLVSIIAYYALRETKDKPIVKIKFFG